MKEKKLKSLMLLTVMKKTFQDIKTLDFNNRESASIKSFAISEIKVTSRFMFGKLLMFAKLCYVTIAVNPKEYFETLKDYKANKKYKGRKKVSRRMEFSNYANRIKSLVNFDTFEKPPAEQKEVSCFTVKQGEMVQTTVQKTKSSQLNDKRFYFPDWILSLPYGHKALEEKDEFKKQKGQKIEKYFWQIYF